MSIVCESKLLELVERQAHVASWATASTMLSIQQNPRHDFTSWDGRPRSAVPPGDDELALFEAQKAWLHHLGALGRVQQTWLEVSWGDNRSPKCSWHVLDIPIYFADGALREQLCNVAPMHLQDFDGICRSLLALPGLPAKVLQKLLPVNHPTP